MLICREVGSIIKVGGTWIEGGSGGMLPRKILKLRSTEIGENVYFASYFCILKPLKEGNQAT